MEEEYVDEGHWDETREENEVPVQQKKSNVLPLWGNERSMNLNPLILTNIQSSHYFKVNLYELKTYHEVIDEIYYKVNHLEPWEKGSRKTAGQTGMCGGVRGVGAGGIVSTAFCLLYKLFTLKLTRKQVIGLITHPDSPYIRVLGFMYIRYTQPPADLWDWYEPYLEDEEELDVKAGGGQMMSIGNILKNFLCKLEWYSTLFPRIPVPIQMKLEKKMSERFPQTVQNNRNNGNAVSNDVNDNTQRKGSVARTGNRFARDDGDYQRNLNKEYDEGECYQRYGDSTKLDRNRDNRSSSRIHDSYRSRSNHNDHRKMDSRRISPRHEDSYRSRHSRSTGEIERRYEDTPRDGYRKRERSRDNEERKYKKDRSSRNDYDERAIEKEIRREHKKSRNDKKHKRDRSRDAIREDERRDHRKQSRSKHH